MNRRDTLFTPDALGVGCAYSSALESLLVNHPELVDVIEVEPQTLWYPHGDSGELRLDEAVIGRIEGYGKPVLLHGVNNPVGGSVRPDDAQARLFADLAVRFNSPWVSEHLSFNRVQTPSGTRFTGFMLPPLQTGRGIAEAVLSVRHLAAHVQRPLALETGVNYFRPDSWELADGDFVAAVCEQADCGILLDLHNIWTNARNGRQSVDAFLSSIPLDRVWELHLAGGSERQGYWLDSHDNPIPPELLAIARELVPDLENLGAMIFELFPVNLPAFGIAGVCRQLEAMGEIWRTGTRHRQVGEVGSMFSGPDRLTWPAVPGVAADVRRAVQPGDEPTPDQWEQGWFEALRRSAADSPGMMPERVAGQTPDPAVQLIAGLISDFRSAMVLQNLQLTSTLLFLTVGAEPFRAQLSRYGADHPPSDYAVYEALGFAEFLSARLAGAEVGEGPERTMLADVLAFEKATLETLLDERPRVVAFTRDPLVLLRSLSEGRLPDDAAEGWYEVEITP